MEQKFERRTFIKTTSAAALGLTAAPYGFNNFFGSGKPELVLVKKGQCRVPVIMPENAGEMNRQAASDLVDYIEKISGARPEILTQFKPAMKSAIWVGLHEQLSEVYPELPNTFNHPEEILIACNGRHLVIAGRDSIFSNTQIEYGTVNAVYTFLQDNLDVRWLWPGEFGEDIVRTETISIPSFEYRFHPTFLMRDLFFRRVQPEKQVRWTRLQRLKLDSMKSNPGGATFVTWWDRFHKDHPDWFALQPDGTRSGYPNPHRVKMCLSNPEVWDQWLADAEDDIKNDPWVSMITAGENDGHSSGICVCESCRAWDHPGGAPWNYGYEGGHRENYVAMTNRYITFYNILARKLKERFPDRDNLYVLAAAYGPSTPPPVDIVLEDNIIISYVGKFPTIDEGTRQRQKSEIREWTRSAPNILYRPNLWYWTGGAWGLPDMTLKNVIEDFRFLAENNCKGLFVDTVQENWSTQAPQYYLMTQLTWNPLQDAQSVLDDYYRRGFGKAAGKIRAYWDLMEEGFTKITNSEGFGPHGRYRYRLVEIFREVYTEDFFKRADNLIQQAAALVAGEEDIYRKRVDFVKTGLDFSRLLIDNIPLMTRVRESGGKDTEAVNKVSQNWEAIRILCENADPAAINYKKIMARMQGHTYQGMMEDYFGPPSEKLLNAEGTESKPLDEPDDID